LGRAR